MMELKEFQVKAMRSLEDAMRVDGRRDIIFKSPTGSGKTIVLTRFMQEWMRDDASVAFVWLTPGRGDLEEQSKAKMDRYCRGASTKLLADVMTSGFSAGDAAFINWEKLTKKGANALRDSERTNFREWIAKARGDGVRFCVVIDESHQNFTEKADAVVELFLPDKIARASATPLPDHSAILVEVREEEVIAAGLIKKLIQINPDIPRRLVLPKGSSPTEYLLEKGLAKLDELATLFAGTVNPLMVVQLPNNSDMLLYEAEEWFAKHHISVENGLLAVWLADRHDNIENIELNTSPQRAVIIKQAVATGWDCPRAHILVKLRENMDETFEIQTVGRIRRMPEAKHYGNDTLDSCYLFTFDEKFTAGVRASLGKNALEAKRVSLKPEHKYLKLTKEQRTFIGSRQDPAAARDAVIVFMEKTFGLVEGEHEQNRNRLEAFGWEFHDETIWRRYKAGDVRTLAETSHLAENELAVRLDTNKHGRQFHHDVSVIGEAAALVYANAIAIIRRLFAQGYFLALGARKLYAFTINNAARLQDVFRNAMAATGTAGTSNPVSEKPFRFPKSFVFTYDAQKRGQAECGKNVYSGYLESAEPRSMGEVKFEKWCEHSAAVDWFFRNGDKGDEYFSIAYEDNAGRQRLFYPDYILSIAKKTWIVEIKGGWNGSGQSSNIDPFAERKALALAAYARRHNLRSAFVCYDANEDELLAAEEGFSENSHAACWRLLRDVAET